MLQAPFPCEAEGRKEEHVCICLFIHILNLKKNSTIGSCHCCSQGNPEEITRQYNETQMAYKKLNKEVNQFKRFLEVRYAFFTLFLIFKVS